jgi:hypothetical protein
MSAKKLTDTQLVLLTAASQHEDSAIELTGKPKRAVATKALIRLLNDGLVEEVAAGGRVPVWRRDNDQGAFALRITARGLAAIGIYKADASPEVAVASGASEVDRDPVADAAFAAIPASRKTSTKRRAASRKGRGRALTQRRVQAIARDRHVPADGGQHHRCDRQGEGLAAALGARVLCGRGAQKARPDAGLGKDRRRTGLQHRAREAAAQEQPPTQGGSKRIP